jgi:protein-S-isoprenylcysteine O-methyltransferase Ste14
VLEHKIDPYTSPPSVLNAYGVHSIVRDFIFPVLSGLILFTAAQTLDWLWGWIYCVLYVAAFAVMDAILVRRNPALLNERGKRKPGIRPWDWVLLLLGVLTLVGEPLVAGFDKRYGWTPLFPDPLRGVGVALLFISFAIVTPAMIVNDFFETSVRIETERGHHVVSSGPYRYIRHPGYAGAILFYIAAPLILGSWWAFIPGIAGVAIYVLRTVLEDRVLCSELDGYKDYTRRVRWRLLPGIW